ncbi:MAG: hypothetical protein Sylvanvirus6_36 [Sylvanvirus sp.]|uniref:Uncharacterized protein n=1 Tax=Sylvanvirus sp. TaxID=2487774 RepID=A0A3G5AHL1_9VIRU|nr:MAG: hypothetical protein Sylvanvirus6_36 [Sylvanvirus sp.]
MFCACLPLSCADCDIRFYQYYILNMNPTPFLLNSGHLSSEPASRPLYSLQPPSKPSLSSYSKDDNTAEYIRLEAKASRHLAMQQVITIAKDIATSVILVDKKGNKLTKSSKPIVNTISKSSYPGTLTAISSCGCIIQSYQGLHHDHKCTDVCSIVTPDQSNRLKDEYSSSSSSNSWTLGLLFTSIKVASIYCMSSLCGQYQTLLDMKNKLMMAETQFRIFEYTPLSSTVRNLLIVPADRILRHKTTDLIIYGIAAFNATAAGLIGLGGILFRHPSASKLGFLLTLVSGCIILGRWTYRRVVNEDYTLAMNIHRIIDSYNL